MPLLSSNLDKVQQKQRWKYVLEKFSHSSTGVVRRNPLPPEAESQLLEIPECKRGRFVRYPANKVSQAEEDDLEVESELVSGEQRPSSLKTLVNGTSPSLTCGVILDMDSPVSGFTAYMHYPHPGLSHLPRRWTHPLPALSTSLMLVIR